MQLQASALPDKLRVGEILDMYRSFYRDPADVSALIEGVRDRGVTIVLVTTSWRKPNGCATGWR